PDVRGCLFSACLNAMQKDRKHDRNPHSEDQRCHAPLQAVDLAIDRVKPATDLVAENFEVTVETVESLVDLFVRALETGDARLPRLRGHNLSNSLEAFG
ncbi:MAG: hypothetical protein ACREJM_08480, partial [Candidatus Saccharimonadales bacterium]